MSSILITGAAGFIGSNVCAAGPPLHKYPDMEHSLRWMPCTYAVTELENLASRICTKADKPNLQATYLVW